ncbi:MAG: hydroxymethylbilane synthase, partial [Planctomycetota bacterium]
VAITTTKDSCVSYNVSGTLCTNCQNYVLSTKDMTTVQPDGLELVSALARGPVEDVLVSREGLSLSELPQGARVATGSQRRRAQLLKQRPDLEITNLRGNVQTRLAKITDGAADATVMARAGLVRMGLDAHITEILPLNEFVPAVSQGIVGLVCRADDEETKKALRAIGDPDAWAAALCERAFLRTLQGGCSAPIGGHARVASGGEALSLHGIVLAPDGARSVEGRLAGPLHDAESLGVRLAEDLIEQGAAEILESARDV